MPISFFCVFNISLIHILLMLGALDPLCGVLSLMISFAFDMLLFNLLPYSKHDIV